MATQKSEATDVEQRSITNYTIIMTVVQVLICGGSGKRLWPLSRDCHPKPFLKLIDTSTLFSRVLECNSPLVDSHWIVLNEAHLSLAKEQGQSLNKSIQYLIEPCGRNTATAIALAALEVPSDTILWVTPADHWIKDDATYRKEVQAAIQIAKEGCLVTFGIQPLFPETGYGYIEKGERHQTKARIKSFKVAQFHEKPTKSVAEKYLASGEYYWNSGMFCFRAESYLTALKTHAPEIYKTVLIASDTAMRSKSEVRIQLEDMSRIPENSIDYAVMEKSDNVVMLESHVKWHDVGSFEQLNDITPKDRHGNTAGKKIITYKAKDNVIIGNDKLIAAVGVDDLVIVDTQDALLVSKKGASGDIKKMVQSLEKDFPTIVKNNTTETRPWGSFSVLLDTDQIKVKKITVNPHSRLSLQSHKHRREHWLVVKGTPIVQVEKDKKNLKIGESIDIPLGAKHRLENKSESQVEIIEIQFGDYLGEDDIIRYHDDYYRVTRAD